jgi:hypothetical protein
MNNDIQAALTKFVDSVQVMRDEYMGKNFPSLGRVLITVERGKRYAKLVCDDGISRCVHCFVDLTNGDILKAASWKAPAKHTRGNILSADPISAVNAHGANYLR